MSLTGVGRGSEKLGLEGLGKGRGHPEESQEGGIHISMSWEAAGRAGEMTLLRQNGPQPRGLRRSFASLMSLERLVEESRRGALSR